MSKQGYKSIKVTSEAKELLEKTKPDGVILQHHASKTITTALQGSGKKGEA